MGKPTGFLEYERETGRAQEPKTRIRHFNEFHAPLGEEEQKRQGARRRDERDGLRLPAQQSDTGVE